MSLLEQFGRQRDSIKARIRRRSRDRRRRQMKLIPNPLVRLEDRQLLSQTFTVTDPVNDGSTGSLNWAIGQVNADTTDLATSPDIIAFDIPGTGPFTMQAPGYTGVANPVIIDGYTSRARARIRSPRATTPSFRSCLTTVGLRPADLRRIQHGRGPGHQ